MNAWFRVFAITMLVACGGNHGGTGSDGGGSGSDGGGTVGDGGIDAPPFSGTCVVGGPQCSNCIDDDNDKAIDGFDLQCTGPNDNDESSFATGIPGDNMDPVEQDCFFDGDSGAGNDGCNIHVCCLLGAKTVADCPIGANKYDPSACPPPIGTGTLSDKCIQTCGKLAPPGCDCFACCTIYDPVTGKYYDVDINPAVSPNCTPDTISDPTKCLSCVKNTQCTGGSCGTGTCTLCPGQTTLPPGCTDVTCPNNEVKCASDGSCPTATYCSNGCCIGAIL